MKFKTLLLFVCIFSTFVACNHPPISQQVVKSLNGKDPKPHAVSPAVQVMKTIYVDKRFTDTERAAIRDAGDTWESLSGGIVRFVFEWDYEVNIETISHKIVIVDLAPDDELTQGFDANIHGLFLSGFLKRADAEYIFLCPIRLINEETLQMATEKELGHELGLHTIPQDKPAVMNPSLNPKVTCPTIYDMEQLCQLLVCDLEEVAHCKYKE